MSYNNYRVGEPGPLDLKVREIIFRSEDFIVYMDEMDVIQWSCYSDKLTDIQFGEIQNEVSYWESISDEIFNDKKSYDYKCLLAEAYARVLDGNDYGSAKNVIENVKNRIIKQGREVLKQNYIISSFLFTIFILVFLAIVVYFSQQIIRDTSQNKYEVLISTLFGGIGAFIFTVLRLKTYEPEIVLSKRIHIIDGLLRIFYGLISGLVIGICIKSNLLLGFLQDIEKSNFVFAFLGLIAGASEILIPNLIKQIEEQ